ncbi:MAG TPA: FAD-binding protein [Polyangiaceae bacterium]
MASLSERGRVRRSVVIGAGASGLMTAVSLCRAGIPVLLASRSSPYGAGSARLRAGFNAAKPEDVAAHAARSAELGAGLGDPLRARLLSESAIGHAAWLAYCGVPFDRDPDGALRRTRLYSAPTEWTLTAGARTGHHVVAVLESLARRLEATDLPRADGASGERLLRRLTAWELVDLVVDDHRIVVGVVLRNTRNFEHRSFPADGVCLASGDHAALFAGSTANLGADGSGVAVAYAAGAALADPELLQFTALAVRCAEKSIALPESLLARGARLISVENDAAERRSSEGQSPAKERAELATAQSLLAPSELARRGAEGGPRRALSLDLSDVPDDALEDALPPQLHALMDAHVRSGRRLPVEVSVHASLGGLLTDLACDDGKADRASARNQSTTLGGLYAAGGAACHGCGAEELPGNELPYRLQSATLAALGIAAYRDAMEQSAYDLPGSLFDKAAERREAEFRASLGDGEDDDPGAARLFEKLRTAMRRACGPKREADSIIEALNDLATLAEAASAARAASPHEAVSLERLRRVLPIARATLGAAERRSHSVGGHFRADAVERKEALRHSFVVAGENGDYSLSNEVRYQCAGQPVTLDSRVESR